jgi:integrase
MPLKLVPPREGKSPNWSIRGTYLGIYVDRSAGTHRRALAAQRMRELEGRIERGEFPEKPAAQAGPTFLSAALAYMKARPQSRPKARYIGFLIGRFRETPIDTIDQAAIDDAANEMYPHVSAASRNAYVYMPMSAILHHAGIKRPVTRPKGALGRTITDHLTEDDAFAIICEAERIDTEFALLLKFLLYTGTRLNEALSLRAEYVQPEQRRAYVPRTKNGRPRTLLLREDLSAALAAHLEGGQHRVFRFHKGGNVYHYLMRAKLAALGLPCPRRRAIGWRPPPNRFAFVNFHTFRHTWATWMRQYGGADLQGLVATGNWSSIRAAQRYAHVVARDEWERVDLLPQIGRKKA